MLNLLPILLQVALDDPAAILAFVVMIYAAGSAIYNLYYTYHWRQTRHRSFIYAAATAVRIATAVGYGLVLFINPLASVAILRPLFFVAMLLHDIVTNKMDTIERYDPQELCEQRLKRKQHEIDNHLSSINMLEHNNKNYRDQLKDMKAEKERMTADTTTIRKSLEDTRAELARKAVKLIEANETMLGQEGTINALKQQIVLMELELRKVKGRDA